MSLASWKEEFYPTDAADCSEKDALEHSIRKWKGIREEALEKHGLLIGGNDNMICEAHYPGESFLAFSPKTCALCWRYSTGVFNCDRCPVVQGGHTGCYNPPSLYQAFFWDLDPEPMIEMLESLRKDDKQP